ncbi:Hypothetical protein BQ3484_458 [Cedratvirus A11]|uniref:BTB domain-containing protein n=1 Tax=Cedratvirus A11 TaxID=1903266 RepID=A0A1M7XV15_9VIRU|nr:Hypothetical protein BQ3484_458 [Cedratvirus A11]SHO33526.1 Hypothetical protein BQ3484_458 [Cedratvirus A11]
MLTGELPSVQADYFEDLVFLASYLDIPVLLDYLSTQVKTLPQRVIDACEECLEVPEIREAILDYYLRKSTYFTARAPRWVKQEFLERETKELPEDNSQPLYIILPRQDLFALSSQKEKVTGSNSRYSRYRKPKNTTPQSVTLPHLQEQTNLHLLGREFYSCPEGLYLKNSDGSLWCGSYTGEGTIPYKSVKSPYGFTIFLPRNFKGDYVYSTDYEVTPLGVVVFHH